MLAMVVGVGLSAAGCSIDEAMPPPRCEGNSSGLIVAQSVPTASMVPCLLRLPDGWTIASVSVDQERTVVRLDSDRAGEGAAVLRLVAACDASDAVPVPTDQPGASRFDEIERLEPGFRARRYYLFDGGCVTWSFDFDSGVLSTESVAVGDALLLVSRDEINESIRESFVDEEL